MSVLASDYGASEIPEGYDPRLYRIRHSAAHILAEAVIDYFAGDGKVELAIGPPVENGFYYDFSLPRPLTEADLEPLTERMREIIRGHHPFVGRELGADEARKLFEDQPYKRELIEDLLSRPDPPPVTVFEQDEFVDLCRGPHVASTDEIDPDAIALLSVAGAHWRGQEDGPRLQRVYGTAWRTSEELKEYLWRLEEANRRDHRKLGKTLELFHFDDTAPGMPYWLPRGLRVLNGLIEFWRREHDVRGYQEIASPLINEKRLWEISGHWDHYRENMFVIPIDEQTTYAVKPMNCPNAMVVFNLKARSYRDLPLRLSDCDVLHRNERSGTLHGLLRTQHIQQDDAHIFVTEEQIAEEYRRIFDLADRFYRIFGLEYRLRLGTRPESFIGDVETWDRAEAELHGILSERTGGDDGYEVADGDGAFYGPKVDILMKDAIGRSWQMGTIQLDFQLPRRFDCRYAGSDNTEHTPVVIHRVIYGSLERFLGILVEHTMGAFPVWLSPEHARVLPVTERHHDAAEQAAGKLRLAGLRVDVDASDKRMGARIREAQLMKIPFSLVIGDREAESGGFSVRERGGIDHGTVRHDDFVAMVQARCAEELAT